MGLYAFFTPQEDTASLTDGELEFVFSLSSSGACWRRKPDPKPLNSGTSFFAGVADLSEVVRLGKDKPLMGATGLSSSTGAAVTLGLGETAGLEKDPVFDATPTELCRGPPGVCLLFNEAAITDAADFGPGGTPPKRAAELALGDGFDASGGVGGCSADGEVTLASLTGSSAGSDGIASAGFGSLVAAAPALRFLGPFARPLRTSAKGAPSAGGSLDEGGGDLAEVGAPTGLSDLEPPGEGPADGGPRARMPASPGLKRAASLLVGAAAGGETTRFSTTGLSAFGGGDATRFSTTTVSASEGGGEGFLSTDSGAETSTEFFSGLSAAGGTSTFGFSLILFWKRSASGVMLRVFSGLAPLTLPLLPSSSRLASASGLLAVGGGPDGVRSCLIPASFSCFHCSFLASRLSLSSSLRSRFWGPPVMVRPRLPRVILSLRTSGATYFSVWALRRLPNLDMNSGCSWALGSETGRERRVLRKSVVGLGAGSGSGLSSGFAVPMGGDLVELVTLGCLPSSGLSEMVSGLGLVGGGDFADSGSACLLGASETSGFSADIDSLELRGAGSSPIFVSADLLLGAASSLKFEVSSLVVGVASFSEICKDS